MKAGRLRKRVEYQVKATAADGYGQPAETWSTVASCWAEIRPLNGTEALIAGQIKGQLTQMVTVRWLGFAFSVLGRFKYGTRILNISSVINIDERNRQVNLMVVEPVTPAEV